MIIIYTESNDVSTNNVIDWLSTIYDGKIKRINTDFFKAPRNKEYFLNFHESINVKSIWYRRPARRAIQIKTIPKSLLIENNIYENLEATLLYSANKELDYTNLYDLHYNYNAEKKLGSATKTEVNKFEVLRIAQNIGIKIPKSILTNSKKQLVKFYNDCSGQIITKLHNMLLCDVEEIHSTYTELVNIEFINTLPKYFFITHFQEKIRKNK